MIAIESNACVDENSGLQDIVRRAAYFWERRAGLARGAGDPSDPTVCERIGTWDRRLSALGLPREAAIRKRLAWDQLDLPSAAFLLGEACPSPFDQMPAWGRLIPAMQLEAIGSGAPIADRGSTLPFRAIYEPIRRLGRRLLAERLAPIRSAVGAAFSADCFEALDDALLTRLSSVGAMVLIGEFERIVPTGERIVHALMPTQGELPRIYYERFVAGILADGYADVFSRYPVMARLWATVLEFWVDSAAMLIERFIKDRDDIAKSIVDESCQPLRVVGLALSMSDAHRSGLSTAIVSLAAGCKLVYKPKNLELDVAWQRLLAWCNGAGAPLSQHTTRVLDRGTHGWCEFVTHQPCRDDAAVRRFYRRVGGLMSLLHLLRGTDAHFENLIAHGEYPCLIDTETLLHPEPAAIDGRHTDGPIANNTFTESVARTGLLPRWELSADRLHAFDISGLADISRDLALGRTPTWKAINTDVMRLQLEDAAMVPAANGPAAPGVDVDPGHYRDDIVQGFEQTYAFLRDRAHVIANDDGPLAALKGASVRYVVRPTRLYTATLQHALMPDRLRNGADFSIELERLACGLLLAADRPAAWSILETEQAALGQLDIPCFHTYTDSLALGCEDGLRIERFSALSGLDAVMRQIGRLGEIDLRIQRQVIRASFEARDARGSMADLGAPQPARDTTASPDWLAAADQIAAQLRAAAIDLDDGSPEWLALKYVHEADRFQVDVAGDGLYDGRLGIALLFAALDYVRGDVDARAFALRMLAPLARHVDECSVAQLEAIGRRAGLGAATGCGAVVYGFTRVAGLLASPVWLERARKVARSISDDTIAADTNLDVIGGAPGALLGLLALWRATGEAWVLERAARCGDHLLAHQTVGTGAWAVGGDRELSGYAHGAAGICDALGRLAAASGERRYAAAARRGRAFEDSLFDPDQSNWHSDRDSAQRSARLRVQWCHGAPGIALSRLVNVDADDATREASLAAAIETTLAAGHGDRDHLCCGTAGRIEAVWTAALALDRSDWARDAAALAAQVIDRAAAGGYRLAAGDGESAFNPSFFQGAAGIGYQWLRMARPELPSVLAFE